MNNEKKQFEIGQFVSDLSGIVGEITGNGNEVGRVRVKFGKDCYRDLKPEQLTLAKYSPDQIGKMRSVAAELLEALQKAKEIIERMSEEFSSVANKHSSYTNGEARIIESAIKNAIL